MCRIFRTFLQKKIAIFESAIFCVRAELCLSVRKTYVKSESLK